MTETMIGFLTRIGGIALLASAAGLAACAAPAAIGTDPALSPEERDRIQRAAARPDIAPGEALRAVTLSFTVEVPLAQMTAWFATAPLEDIAGGTSDIPAVARTELLTERWGGANARRRVILDDGSTALEDILVDDLPARFRYIAWNYTSDAARFVEYGVGEFRLSDADDGRTRVDWTYAFKPRGALGRMLVGRFVNTTWRAWMESAAAAMADGAEADYRETAA